MLIFSSRFRELDDIIRRGPFEANAFKFPYSDFIDGDTFPGCRKLAEEEEELYGEGYSHYHVSSDYCREAWAFQKDLLRYVKKAKPIYTPLLVMALTVALAKEQGYKIRNSKFDYKSDDDFYITPTVGDIKIPTGYGSNSRTFIILSDFALANPVITSRDDRKGWEYGHSTVIKISRVNGEYILTNNQDSWDEGIKSFPNVNELVDKYSIDELAHLIGIDSDKFNFAF